MDDPREVTEPDPDLLLLRPGRRVFDRFVLDRVLGRGGMGVVWKAHDQALEKEVALKFIHESQARSQEAVEGLKRETRRCQDLRHSGIVAIFDLHQSGDLVAVSMEYVEGATLAALKAERSQGCFDAMDLLPWLDQLGVALTYAHEDARVVHRDLKPSNIILASKGRLKVMDFGISQPLSETVAGTGLWLGGVSPPYGSPQQISGDRPSIADDVYSLGATIYDLMTGKPPFFRGQIDIQVLEVVPPSMQERRAELDRSGLPIPPVWEQVVADCLAKRAELRPASIAEAIRRLHDVSIPVSAPAAVRVTVPRSEPVRPTETRITGEIRHHPTEPAPAKTTIAQPPAPLPPVAHRWARGLWRPERRSDWIGSTLLVLTASLLTAAGIHFARHARGFTRQEVPSIATPTPGVPSPTPIRSRLDHPPPPQGRRPPQSPLDAPPRRL